jgi:hypothetical protein
MDNESTKAYVFRPQERGLIELRFDGEQADLPSRKGFIFIREALRLAGQEISYVELVESLEEPAATAAPLPAPAMTAEEESTASSRLFDLSDRVDEARSRGDGELAERLETERAMIQRQMHTSGRGVPKQAQLAKPSAGRARSRVRSAVVTLIEFLRTNGMPRMARHLEVQLCIGEDSLCYHPTEPAADWSL